MKLTQMAQMSCMIQNLNGVMVLSQLTRLQISDSQETAHAHCTTPQQCTTDLRPPTKEHQECSGGADVHSDR